MTFTSVEHTSIRLIERPVARRCVALLDGATLAGNKPGLQAPFGGGGVTT